MRKTETSEKIKDLKSEAAKLEKEAATLSKIRRMKPGAKERLLEATRLEEKAKDLKPKARLEDLDVYQVAKEKRTKNSEARIYMYWHASWREETKVRNVYLGSAKKLTREEALEKARQMKAEALGINL